MGCIQLFKNNKLFMAAEYKSKQERSSIMSGWQRMIFNSKDNFWIDIKPNNK
jgi:hypothetical protein